MEIVGLKNCVPDDVNKLIAKFVGLKPHPIATHLKDAATFYTHMRHIMTWTEEIVYWKRCASSKRVVSEFCDIGHLNSKRRREIFAHLPKWLKMELLFGRFKAGVEEMFKTPKINQRFILEQMRTII